MDTTASSSPENRIPETREQTRTLVRQQKMEPTDICGPATTSMIASISLGVHAPTTPRIDISRASSSSHHEDSRDSSPENVFEQVSFFPTQNSFSLACLFSFNFYITIKQNANPIILFLLCSTIFISRFVQNIQYIYN